MTDQEKPTPSELINKMKQLNNERALLLTSQAVLQSKRETAKENMDKIIQEMHSMGTSPEKINSDISTLYDQFHESVQKYESDLDSVRQKLQEAEKAVK